MNNADMPAMPSGIKDDTDNIGQLPNSPGLTKREYFAGLAMQALLSGVNQDLGFNYDEVADDACRSADALLAELKKERN